MMKVGELYTKTYICECAHHSVKLRAFNTRAVHARTGVRVLRARGPELAGTGAPSPKAARSDPAAAAPATAPPVPRFCAQSEPPRDRATPTLLTAGRRAVRRRGSLSSLPSDSCTFPSARTRSLYHMPNKPKRAFVECLGGALRRDDSPMSGPAHLWPAAASRASRRCVTSGESSQMGSRSRSPTRSSARQHPAAHISTWALVGRF